MIRQLQLTYLLAAFALATLPASAIADSKSGKAELQELKTGETEKALKVSLGDRVKADCKFFVIPDFFEKKVVSVQARIRNTGDKTLYYGYYVAFFDKDKQLIATSSFGGSIAKLDPGKETNIGNVIQLPPDQIKRIAHYQVTVLEDDKEFGK